MALRRLLRSCSSPRRSFASSSRSSPTACGVQLDAGNTVKVFHGELFKQAQVAGKRLNFHYGLVYPAAKAFVNGPGNPSKFGQKEQDTSKAVFIPSPKEAGDDWDDNNDGAVFWLKRLWVPALAVLTVVMGWNYPFGLIVNLLILVWTTKPSPASIHVWLKQRRIRETSQKIGFERLKEQLKFSAVMHVHVEDHILYCIAKVRSLTDSMIVIGCLGDWWVLHSTTASIRI